VPLDWWKSIDAKNHEEQKACTYELEDEYSDERVVDEKIYQFSLFCR